MGGGENPTYSLIFSEMFLFLFIYCCIQVYSNLQPLCVCLSFQGTMNIIDKISEDHDIDVQLWAD